MNSMATEQIEDRSAGVGIRPISYEKTGTIPLHLDSLDQRLDMLMDQLQQLYRKISPVLSDSRDSEREVAETEPDKFLSPVAARVHNMDEQVRGMITEIASIVDRVEL